MGRGAVEQAVTETVEPTAWGGVRQLPASVRAANHSPSTYRFTRRKSAGTSPARVPSHVTATVPSTEVAAMPVGTGGGVVSPTWVARVTSPVAAPMTVEVPSALSKL